MSKSFVDRYKSRVRKTIREYSLIKEGEKVALAISGGKDSVALAWALNELGYDYILFHLNLRIGEFSKISLETVKQIADILDKELVVWDVKDFGVEVRPVGKMPPCAVCGIIKRYLMNKFAFENNYIIATAHNLDDIVAFAFNNILSNQFEYLVKLRPRNEGKREIKLATKIKPLFFIPEEWNKRIVEELNLPYVKMQCPNKKLDTQSRLKQIINNIERGFPGFKLNFARVLVKYNSAFPEAYPSRTCKICGFPSYGEVCSFCKLKEKLNKIKE